MWICGYADDLILFIQSQTDLQNTTNLLDRIFEHFGLKINELKTETIVDSIDQQIDRVVTTVIEAHVQILLVIVIFKL